MEQSLMAHLETITSIIIIAYVMYYATKGKPAKSTQLLFATSMLIINIFKLIIQITYEAHFMVTALLIVCWIALIVRTILKKTR